MKVASYARVSTDDQDPGMQLSELRRYAAAREFKVVEEYVDAGISGAKDSRPALDRLMAHARKRRFQAIVVWKFDRFARSTRHLLRALDEFRGLGIDFLSITENIDTSTPMGKAMFTIIGAMAEFERGLTSERVRAGLRKAREKGKHIGRPRVRVDMEKLRRMRAEGMVFREIAKKITAWCNGRLVRPSPALLCRLMKENAKQDRGGVHKGNGEAEGKEKASSRTAPASATPEPKGTNVHRGAPSPEPEGHAHR